ncbi:lipopolysaccharide heptosyltransferase II [Candidatus Thioglobus sp.]|nr:lipopolysaccharide heptosyltransferase II [Candidatus Thioglobus sp.]
MKILIELPSWLGDAVMTTPAIENLVNFFDDSEIILIGSVISIEALKNNPKVTEVFVLEKQYFNLYKTIKSFGKFDAFFSFRSSFRSKVIKFFVSSPRKYQFDKNKFIKGHQVEKYNNFINNVLNVNLIPGKLKLPPQKRIKNSKNKILGINPGASYGIAKRWYPEKFASVAFDLSNNYDIIILGSEKEIEIAGDIEKYLIEKGVANFKNLSGQTSIFELFIQIANLDLLITGDSGPMHLAAAYQIPTVAIFGPTNSIETSQWLNEKSKIVKKSLECQPCMKRECPLKHHNCMKLIDPSDVLREVKNLN